MYKYETLFVLHPELGEAQVKESIERSRQLIESMQGQMGEVQEWGMRELAYPINKNPRGIYTLLQYDYVDDMLERRTPHREAHLSLARAAQARGVLINAGAIGAAEQAIFVFAADAEAEAEAFVDADPYVREGLVPSWRITTWTVAV